MSFIIRRIPKPKQIVHPTGHIKHRPLMRKSLEAITTVVSTITGITYATERHIGDAGVGHNVIYCYAAGVRF